MHASAQARADELLSAAARLRLRTAAEPLARLVSAERARRSAAGGDACSERYAPVGSAQRRGSPRPHLRPGQGSFFRISAPGPGRGSPPAGHICAGTGLTPAKSAPGPSSHLHRDCAHPGHICAGTALRCCSDVPYNATVRRTGASAADLISTQVRRSRAPPQAQTQASTRTLTRARDRASLAIARRRWTARMRSRRCRLRSS